MASPHSHHAQDHNQSLSALELVTIVEDELFAQMENINPAPITQNERVALFEFLNLAERYAALIEPTQLFTRRITAFLDTIEYMRIQQQNQQERPPRVQVTRIGARRIFADISHEVMQDENIAANLI
jgi:hypothetical protein